MIKFIAVVCIVFLTTGCTQKNQKIDDIRNFKNIPKVQLFEKRYRF